MEGTIRGIADRLLAAVSAERRAQVEQLQVVAELVDASGGVAPITLAGGERLKTSGADGTPEVAEFLVPELSAMLGVGEASAWHLINDLMNLRHRHPRAWAALGGEGGDRPLMRLGRLVKSPRCVRLLSLGADAARWVDLRLESSWGRLAWGRIRRKAEGLILSADQALARRRAEARRAERYVYVRHEGDGSSMMVARMGTADAVCLSRAIDAIANSMVLEGRGEPLRELRSEALGELARPSEGGTLPSQRSTLVVHVSRETVEAGGGVAREDAVGPLLVEQVRQLLAHDRVRVVPVLDLVGDAGADGYEIADRMREQVRIRDPFSVFPFSTTRSVHADLDHSEPFRTGDQPMEPPPGQPPPPQTRPSNLGPFGRLEHRAKTHTGWQMIQTEPGVFEWRSPFGYRYRVARGYTEAHQAYDVAGPEAQGGVVEFGTPPCLAVVDYAA